MRAKAIKGNASRRPVIRPWISDHKPETADAWITIQGPINGLHPWIEVRTGKSIKAIKCMFRAKTFYIVQAYDRTELREKPIIIREDECREERAE